MRRRYGDDVLAARRERRRPAAPVEVEARRGVRIEHGASRFAGTIVDMDRGTVTVRDDRGRQRVFPMRPGAFRSEGRPATLVLPRRAEPSRPAVTASGSLASADATGPRVARASRIWVEGVHDAELLEKVWGDDLREAAVVVEPLGGIDDLAAAIAAFGPATDRRLGVLVDHLVPGSKEHRIAAAVHDPHVLITGHPYVDVWAGVRPRTIGLAAWPRVPRGQPWKDGVCAALGADDPARFWRRLLRSVSSYADLEQPLVGAVEQLLDFVTVGPTDH